MNEDFFKLLDKYLDRTITSSELKQLATLLEFPDYQLLLAAFIDKTLEAPGIGQLIPEVDSEGIYQEILKATNQNQKTEKTVSIKKYYRSWVAAAAIVILVASGVYFIFNRNKEIEPIAKQKTKTDILPGHDGAVLTLADGSKIVLDNARDGKITEVAVKKGNRVSYQNSDLGKGEYNTMTTPKGRQYSLVLPDGSQVWLNAASSITYPTAFMGKERKVTITGEAYFEVAHDPSKPFHVNVNGMDVEVLGTHFNINSYSDEGSIKTTLLQGRVKVTTNQSQVTINPGQQAKLQSGELSKVSNVDVDEVMAWKNGYFSFKNADIKTVMHQLSRWYDIEVVFSGAMPNQEFNGEIGRNLTLKEVLEGLAFTSQHFKIEDGKKLIIRP